MNKYGFFAISLLAFSACISEEETTGLSPENPQAITVSTYIGQNTRALDKTAFETGDVIGLYACQTTGDYANIFADNFMKNLAVTNGEAGWTYSPLMAWPEDENERVSFIAFYPQIDGSTATSYPFTVNMDKDLQTDPLWCTVKNATMSDRNGSAINGSEYDASFTASTGSVPLKFKHMLSKVKFGVKLSGAYTDITARLNSISLNNVYYTGTFNIASDLNGGYWTTTDSYTNFTVFEESDESQQAITTEETNVAEMLMIPQTLTTNNANITISYTHTLAEGGEKTVTRTIYLPNEWDVDKVYNYVVNISLDINTITISANVGDWDETVQPNFGDETPNAVDLGLSVKWASCDYGTVSPYDAGPTYDFDSTKSMNFDSTWGPNWSSPTEEHWVELLNNCDITPTTVNGIPGYLVTGTNGNTIFLRNTFYWTTYSSRYYYYYVDLLNKNTYSKSSSDKYPIRPVFK